MVYTLKKLCFYLFITAVRFRLLIQRCILLRAFKMFVLVVKIISFVYAMLWKLTLLNADAAE